MAVNLSPIWGAGAQLFDNSGNVLTGGKIYTYAAGTTTPAATYTSSNGITANSNPIILNSAGRVPYEIWLTDGVSYKFVLKDSSDVLIATYDNLNGINSNFIAYTAQQEIQTATAGQTVFNLTTMQYQPGTNNLSVFVDGVNQYGPGASYAYVETDSDTVTFVSGLHVGASVKFTTASPVASAVMNAENVAYDPPFTDAVGTNVEDKLAQTVSVKDFGAVGDGVTDDTQAIQNAIDYVGGINGGVILLPQGTYGITAQLNVPYSNVILQGEGSDNIHDGGGTGANPATTIKWISASTSSASMISFYTPSGASESKRAGGGIQNIFIDCSGKVAGGIDLLSYNKGNFSNITIYYPVYVGVILNCYQAGTIADAADTQSNIFTQISVRCLSAASINAHGFHLTSSNPNNPPAAGANSSFNTFLYCDAQVQNGNGFWMNDADNNTFNNCRAFVTGTGYGLLLEGAADANYFYGASYGTIKITGTASGRYSNSVRNCFVCVDTGNGTTYPTIDTGCRIYWLDQLGVETNLRSYKAVLADGVVTANSFYDKYPLASAVIPNDSNSNAIWCNAADTNRWRTYTGQVYSATNVDFSISQLAGSGIFSVEAPLVVRDYMYSPSAPTTASGANMYISTSTTPAGLIYRSTSSVKYKTDIEDIQPEYSDNLLKMRPIWYRSTSPMDKKDWSWFGLLAEELAKIEPRLVDWSYAEDCYKTDESGKKVLKENAELTPDGVFYDRITALLIDLVQRQEKRIAELEKKVNGVSE